MKFPIRMLNVCGGALFASSSLLFLESVIDAQVAAILGNINTALRLVVDSQPSVHSSTASAWLKYTSDKLLDLPTQLRSTQIVLLALATVGAGLTCLREKRN